MSDSLYNINIERAVLSAIIFDPQIFEDVLLKLNSKDFYLPFHQYLFEAMEELSKEEKPIDEEFLKSKLIKQKRFDEVAMLEILATNPISNIDAYVEEIKARSTKRALASLATTIKRLTVEEDLPTDEVMNQIERKLYEITQNSIIKDFRESKDITLSVIKEVERLKALGNRKLVGVDTGFLNLNKKISGFGKGDFIVIAARPAMGKTSFVLNIAYRAILRGEGVAFFSLEMPAEQLMLRMLSTHTSIPLQRLRVGDLNEKEWNTLVVASNMMSRRKLFVDDSGYATIHHIRSKLRKLKSQHPEISMAIIDYLQLMSGDNREGRQLVISEISRGLKQLARELQMPILALSQLNRSVESRENKRPMLSDLRESGSIEQDADVVMFVYRDAVYREAREKEKEERERNKKGNLNYKSDYKPQEEEEVELIIGKQRNGPIGTVNLVFQKRYTRFMDGKQGYDVSSQKEIEKRPRELPKESKSQDEYLEKQIELPPPITK